jgi:hypothetical protein
MNNSSRLISFFLSIVFFGSAAVHPVAANSPDPDLPPATDTIGLVTSRNYQTDNLAMDDQYIYPTFNALMVVDLNPESLRLFNKFRTDYIYDLVINGQYAYAGQQEKGLRVFDITVATPTIFSSHALPGGAYGMALTNNRLLVTTGKNGLVIRDTTKPYDMPQTASLALDGFVRQLAVDGSLAVIAAGDAGGHVVDISNPVKPEYLATINNCGPVESTALNGKTAYIACGFNGFSIVDLTDPKAPKEISSLDTNGFVKQIVVRDELAYIAARDAGVLIVDISNPEKPRIQATYNTPGGAWDIVLKDNNIYVADYPYGLLVLRYNPPAMAEINHAGATITSASDQIVTTIASEVFGRDVTFIHEPLPAINTPIGPEPALVKVSSFFRNSAWSGGDQVSPQKDYAITIPVNITGLTERQKQMLYLYYWDPEIKRWRKDLSTRLEPISGVITATPDRLGIWGVFYDRNDVFSPIPVNDPASRQ